MPRMALVAFGLLALAGCQKPAASPQGATAHGRYLGVGVYEPGPMWRQIARSGAPAGAAAATLKDDEQVIVVVDSKTGEVRQCGNLSGVCIGMNPWTAAATPTPANMLKHADAAEQP
jgi:hypothetical protein